MTNRARKPRSRTVVQVTVQGGPHPGCHRDVIRRRAIKMLAHLGLSDVELSVALVDDETMRELNRRYRRRNRPTDVLSFSMAEGEPLARASAGPELLGDVVLSADTARRQARARRRPLRDELTTLLAHGLLHLLGYDHRTDRQEREMDSLRVELERAAARRQRRAPKANRESSRARGASPKRA
ncbi:MAG: rRNA maturation RNase YbeY [Deltaproteobacteria bacterium]|jgi:probable rRNA maturation factor|nr:rRNA maturation RNase YbeY [Deltaproteobacteria bacterium]MBW2536054.1 rRNA maturation RNase YbeY [Deltaproteobacteria bacterium]